MSPLRIGKSHIASQIIIIRYMVNLTNQASFVTMIDY